MRIFLLLAVTSASIFAQDQLSGAIKSQFAIARTNLVKAAEKMPEDNYSFKPTPEVRSFGQIVGHVANANYAFCSAAMSEPSPSKENIEKSKTSKADLVAALKAAMEYCDKAYNGMTDEKASKMVKAFGREMPSLAALTFNTAHDMEHYGNIVTYMRLKGLVPPSSEGN